MDVRSSCTIRIRKARSWEYPRRVVTKVEWHQGKLFSRVRSVVTNLSAKPGGIVHFYNGRGMAEQWIREGKYALNWTRLSCHGFLAGQLGRLIRLISLISCLISWVLAPDWENLSVISWLNGLLPSTIIYLLQVSGSKPPICPFPYVFKVSLFPWRFALASVRHYDTDCTPNSPALFSIVLVAKVCPRVCVDSSWFVLYSARSSYYVRWFSRQIKYGKNTRVYGFCLQ